MGIESLFKEFTAGLTQPQRGYLVMLVIAVLVFVLVAHSVWMLGTGYKDIMRTRIAYKNWRQRQENKRYIQKANR